MYVRKKTRTDHETVRMSDRGPSGKRSLVIKIINSIGQAAILQTQTVI